MPAAGSAMAARRPPCPARSLRRPRRTAYPGSMPHARHDLAAENLRSGRTLDAEDADQSAFHTRQSMVDQGVVAGYLQLEINDDGAAGRHRDGLDAFQRRRVGAAQHVDLVEDLADHMEG